MKLSLFALLLTIVFGLASVESCEDQGKKDKFKIKIGGKNKKKNCKWVSKNTKKRCKKTTVDGQLVKDLCPVSCDNCPDEEEPPSGDGCCTNDYKVCITWCGDSKDSCLNCSSDVGWIPNGEPSGDCKARWTDCSANKNGCCDGLTCQDKGDFFQCLPDDGSTPAPVQPTKEPTPAPTKKTKRPTKTPTKSPVPDSTPPPTKKTKRPTKRPTKSPVTDSNGCCSVDYKSCVDYCGSTEDSCINCGDHVWLSNGALDTCGERWGGCGESNDSGHSGCCGGLTCQWRDGYDYFACLPGEGNSNLTDPPVDSPTGGGGGGGGGGGDLVSGIATMYGGNPSGNACGYIDLPQVTFPNGFSVAIGDDNFDNGYGCGACYEVTCEGPYGNNPNCYCGEGEQKKVIVQATDQCPECSNTHLDLNTEAFVSIVKDKSPAMAGTCGKIETSFRRVSCDFKSSIKIRSKGGTSGFWYGLHVDDVAGYGAISSVRLREANRRQNGQNDFDIVCEKSSNASFWLCDRPGNREIFAKLDVQLTDSAGRVLKSNNVITNLNGQQEFDFGKNFEPIPGGAPTPTEPVAPTAAPVEEPTQAPAPTTPFSGELMSTDEAMDAWEVFNGLESVTYKNSENPPKYAFVASGGVAGSGGSVVSEGQAYGLLITGTILASWDTHAGQISGANRNKVLKYFEGYYNFWKEMCENSSTNTGSNCQGGGKWCKSGSNSYVCLPDWKHYKTGGSEATGPAPDGDEDAIVGIILAVKAVENDANKPSWYDEARKWADASASAFFEYEVDASRGDHRLVKLGSCWGGWEGQGNNPSYHSPGSYRVMKDYQKTFPNNDRNGYSAVPQSEWKKLIDTSHEVLRAVQCSNDGAMVPNWATIGVNGGNIEHTGGSFSGSGTPQYEYGAEGARTTFRVALDAALFPEKSSEWSPYLSSFNYRLDSSFNNGSFSSNTFPACKTPNTNQNINMFGGWQNNAFIYGPTYTALIASSPDITNAEAMADAAGKILSNSLPNDYYPRSWAMISNLMLNGAMESAGDTLKQ